MPSHGGVPAASEQMTPHQHSCHNAAGTRVAAEAQQQERETLMTAGKASLTSALLGLQVPWADCASSSAAVKPPAACTAQACMT